MNESKKDKDIEVKTAAKLLKEGAAGIDRASELLKNYQKGLPGTKISDELDDETGERI